MPAQNQFQGTGILDGQIVEAPHVSQSVDAFTAQKDYDIIISGSLEVTGSVNFSGSLINEYTGQFKTLGIGTPAPTSPTMLHVKADNLGGFDPVVSIEGKTGGDEARLRLKNLDVEYDLGIYGSFSDDFRLVQDQTGTPKYPFIIDKDTESYTLYLSGNSVGLSLGSTSPSQLAALPAGSFQALNLISGSEIRGTVVSASGAGVNIHGTASYANYIETAQTASYVKSTGIDFHYSISQQINHNGTIAAATGSFNHLKVDGTSGIALRNVTDGAYTRFISGSTEADEGSLFIGTAPGGTFIEIDQPNNYIKLHSDMTYIDGSIVARDDVLISGSFNSSIVVGPNGAPGSNNPSASLLANDLKFNRNNTAYIGNYNTDGTSKLQISAGGGGTTAQMAIEVSASRDVKLSGSLNIIGENPTSTSDLKAFYNLGKTTNGSGDKSGRLGYYRLKPVTITSTIQTAVFEYGKVGGTSNIFLNDQKILVYFKFCAIGIPSSGDGVYLEREFLYRYSDSNNTWTSIQDGTLIRYNSNSVYNTATLQAQAVNVSANNHFVQLQIDQNTTTSTDWTGWIEIKRIAFDDSALAS